MATKLNLGSGLQKIPGFINIDRKIGLEAFPLTSYAHESVDEIRASHILEHFPHSETATVLKDWVRTLRPGSWLKIAVPDFQWIAAHCKRNDLPIEGYLMGGQTDESDYHKAIFDEPKLTHLLREAGLVDIQHWTSEIGDAASMPVSLNLMGRKPEKDEAVSGNLEVKAKTVAVGSVPRLGWQAHFGCLFKALNTAEYSIPFWKFGGAFWEQGMTKGFQKALDEDVEWIIAVDYDTIIEPEDVRELLTLAALHPEADAIVPWQSRRGGDGRYLFTIADAAGNARLTAPVEEFEVDLTPITTGHFGLTLIKTAILKKMEKPWFMSQPNLETGEWDNKRIDADIWFWRQLHKAGGQVFIANNVRVGHLEEEITWVDREFNVFRQTMNEWNEKGKPEACR
jgi:predicted SAM-dependent methyltransferase